ncbi:MAG: SRPBCC family protein [Chloroflexi bacterium]|nr:SRPBCC family protein [Chloroflexota bacterium]
MADFERSATVGVGADAAFALFADPERLPEYVPAIRLEETIAVDGDPDAETEVHGDPDARETRFIADRGARRVEWGTPGGDYHGSIEVSEGTPSTCGVTLRLHLRDDAGPAEVNVMLDQTIRNIKRVLAVRRR